jgi:guanine deaminase
MEGLGRMMDNDPDLPLQTHLAENPAEIEFTKCMSPLALSEPTPSDALNKIALSRSFVPVCSLVHSRLRSVPLTPTQYYPRTLCPP